MSADKLNRDKFDEVLRQGLRRHLESSPADFTARTLSRIREAEEQKILARVVMQERLALAGCIVLGIITIVVAVVFPSVASGLTKQAELFIAKISQTIETVSYEWQYYTVLMGVLGFAVYSLVDLLVDDS